LLRKEGKQPALVAADLQRPAAIEQLEQLGRQIQVPVFSGERSDPVKATRQGIDAAEGDVVVVDTAGRLHVDEALMEELASVRKEAKPTNVLLVLDAMTGQEAVAVAQAFQERVDFDGVVLTKLDGDARGGAALSVKAVTGKPIKLVSVGEKVDQLEYFHPDRMASRILGMGDVLSLIEKAEAAVEEDEREELERRMMQGEFTFDDFLKSYKMLRRMGPLQGVMKLIPGLGNQLRGSTRWTRSSSRASRGHPLDDPARAGATARDRRLAPAADRARQRHRRPARSTNCWRRASRWRR
jgi:signal recognition particle subunit SRP54